MSKLIWVGFNMDTSCVEARFSDGAMISVDCKAVETALDADTWQRSELDWLIYNEPLDKLFAQGLASGIANSVTTAIVGSLLCIAYAATKTKAGSLNKE